MAEKEDEDKKLESKNIKINLWDIITRLLIILILSGILYFCFTLSSVKNDVINHKAEISSLGENDTAIISREDKNYYEKTVEEVRANTNFIEWFFGILATLGVALIGIQVFKNERGYAKRLGMLKKEIDEQDKKLKATNDNFAKDFKYLKEVEFNLQLGLAVNKTIPSEKIDDLEELAKNSEYKNKLGKIYYYMGYYSYDDNYKIICFKRAIEEFEKNGDTKCDEYLESFNIRGCSYWNTGQKDKAKEDYKKVVKLSPESAVGKNCKGLLKVFEEEYDDAIKFFNQAINIKPRYWWAVLNKVPAYFWSGQYQQAIETSNKAIELNPNYFVAYCNRAYAKNHLGDELTDNDKKLYYYNEAIKDCEKSIELNSNYFNVYNNMAYAKIGIGSLQSSSDKKQNYFEEALEYSDKALELIPNHTTYNCRGFVHEKLERYVEALEDYNKSLKIESNYKFAKTNKERLLEEHPELEKIANPKK
ncbi:MAG: tetratricopeptide repeat protein [Fusobacteriaceae bacterium]